MNWLNIASAGVFMPTQATDVAKQVDSLYSFLLITSFISCVILIGGMIYFALKYQRKTDSDKTAYITHNTFLEFLWSFIPLVIFMIVFGWGWFIYHQMRSFPKDALEVHIVGKQWAWEAIYKSGVKSGNLVVVPVNRDVKLIMTSNDVLHSFYIPSMRIKQDLVPGRYTALGFKAELMGEFHIFCAEYCGTSHSGMMGILKVVSQEDYDKWLENEAQVGTLPLAQRGEKLFQIKACVSCHNINEPGVKVGPSLWHKFGKEEILSDDSKVLVDENYVRESILNPNAKIVKGFPQGVMPSFQGQLSETELTALVEYIKSSKE